MKHKRLQRGFTLLEVLLTVGVSATFLFFVIGIGQAIAERQASRAAAGYVAQINKAVEVMLSNPARFMQLYYSFGGSLARQAEVEDLINGTGILAGQNRNPLLSANFPLTAPLGQTYRLIFRMADNIADPNDAPAIEVFVVSETKLPDKTAVDVATALGGTGGALRNAPTAATADLRGIYGSWIVPMTDLAGTPWHAAVVGSTPPTLRNGSYVVSYNYMDLNRIARDYLYRMDMGDAELNTMRSDLSLGGYNLFGADDVVTDGTLTTDQIFVKGRARLEGGTVINGNLQADGPATAAAITAGGPAQISVTGGAFTADNITTDRAGFQSLTTDEMTTTGELRAENVSIPDGTLDVTSPSGIFATSDGLIADETLVGGQLRTSNLTGNNLTVQTGNTGMIFLQTTGAFSQSGGTTQVDRLSVSGTTKAGGSTNWSCGNGCGE